MTCHGYIYFGFDEFGVIAKLMRERCSEEVRFLPIQVDSVHCNPHSANNLKIICQSGRGSETCNIDDINIGWCDGIVVKDGKLFFCGIGRDASFVNSSLSLSSGNIQKVVYGWRYTYVLTDEECHVVRNWNFGEPLVCRMHLDAKAKCLDSGELFTVLVSEDGQLFDVKINNDSVSPVLVPQPHHIKSVSCGKEHVLLLTSQGTVLSYGLGSRGQLGHGSTEKEDKPKVIEALEGIYVKDLAAGGWHSCAVSDIGDLYVWGWNECGQLGFPSKSIVENTDICNPACNEKEQVVGFQCIPKLLDFPNELVITTVSCGSRHTAVVTETGELWTWGWNGYQQLGLPSRTFACRPVKVPLPDGLHVKNIKCSYWSTLAVF